MENNMRVSVNAQVIGQTARSELIVAVTLENPKSKMRVRLISVGASVNQLWYPDTNGVLSDLVLGYDSWHDYFRNPAYMGVTCGRYANRIKNGTFDLNDKTYKLAINNGPNTLHGGLIGASHRVWKMDSIKESDRAAGVVFSIDFADGEEGFPGSVHVKVTYLLTLDDELIISYEAKSNMDTVLNLTNHSYFNLDGEGRGSVLDHKIKIQSQEYLELDVDNCPTGEILSCLDTPFDFAKLTPLSDRVFNDFAQIKTAKGLDTPFCLKGDIKEESVYLESEKSGRFLQMFTTAPCVQVYTGNWLNDEKGKKGHIYADYAGVALEAQSYPAAPNFPHFPSTVLNAHVPFESTTKYLFGIKKSH